MDGGRVSARSKLDRVLPASGTKRKRVVGLVPEDRRMTLRACVGVAVLKCFWSCTVSLQFAYFRRVQGTGTQAGRWSQMDLIVDLPKDPG